MSQEAAHVIALKKLLVLYPLDADLARRCGVERRTAAKWRTEGDIRQARHRERVIKIAKDDAGTMQMIEGAGRVL